MSNTGKRIGWIDIIRGIGIILVLIGHNNPPFIRTIFGFHMGLFFILSGYIYKNSDESVLGFIRKTFRNYIIPYYILAFINLILHLFSIVLVTRSISSVNKELLVRYLRGIILVDCDNMPSCGTIWFLVSLAIALVIFMIIRISNKWIRAALLICCCIAACFLEGRILPFRLHTVPIAVLFIEAGYLLRHFDIPVRLSNNAQSNIALLKAPCSSAVLLLIGALCIKYNPVESWIDINNARFGLLPLNVCGAVSVTLAVMLISIVLDRYVSIPAKALSALGRNTMFLMGFDAASNLWGGLIAQILHISVAETWYKAFVLRSAVLAVWFIVWKILQKVKRKS